MRPNRGHLQLKAMVRQVNEVQCWKDASGKYVNQQLDCKRLPPRPALEALNFRSSPRSHEMSLVEHIE